MVKKEIRFIALIIPVKDAKEFFREHPYDEQSLKAIAEDYANFRAGEGKKESNDYVVVNMDEPYIEQVWKIILEGEE
jgi:hypothetical protein